jgi:lipopolysaccharide transport system permease protein
MITRHYIDFITVLTHKEMKVRYKSSVLGYFWSIAHPLAFALIFFIAFKIIMRIQMENYALFLITGLFPWQWLANSVNVSPMVFLGNASMVKKVNFSRGALPLVTVLQDGIHFVLSIPVIVLFMFVYHKSPSLSWLYGLPILLGVQFMMTYGVCLVVSSVNPFFRDMERLGSLFIMFMFYLTPIIYPESMVPERYKYLLNLNPFAPLMISWRNLFLDGTLDAGLLTISLLYSVAIFAFGYAVYKRLSWKLAEVL